MKLHSSKILKSINWSYIQAIRASRHIAERTHSNIFRPKMICCSKCDHISHLSCFSSSFFKRLHPFSSQQKFSIIKIFSSFFVSMLTSFGNFSYFSSILLNYDSFFVCFIVSHIYQTMSRTMSQMMSQTMSQTMIELSKIR